MDYAEKVRRGMFGDEVYEQMVLDGMFDPVTVCEEKSMVRKEFVRESDIAMQLQRFQAGQTFTRVGVNGVYDDSLDLLSMHEMVKAAESKYRHAPDYIREKYSTFGELDAAARSGELDAWLKERSAPVPPKEGSAPVPPKEGEKS